MGVHERTNFLGSQDVGFADQRWFQETLAESIMPYLDEARWLLVGHYSAEGALPTNMAISLLLQGVRGPRSFALPLDVGPGKRVVLGPDSRLAECGTCCSVFKLLC